VGKGDRDRGEGGRLEQQRRMRGGGAGQRPGDVQRIARSRDPGLHGRKPVFRTPRALALSYTEGYVDYTGRIQGYAVEDLRVLGSYDWRLSERNAWKVERLLLETPHRQIAYSDARHLAMQRRYREFREAHGHKPWKYYSGRSAWTELPPEFRRHG